MQEPAANVPEQVLTEQEVCSCAYFEGAGDERLNHPACRRCSLGSTWMAPRTSSSAFSIENVVQVGQLRRVFNRLNNMMGTQ